MKSIDDRWGQCSNKLFHLSVPPSLYQGILNELADSKLTRSCADGIGWTRILIEKPFGSDMTTACDLDKLLGKLFKEDQIFRIDHYLAKEALPNLLAFRFSIHYFLSPSQTKHVERIHIKLLEKETIGSRGAFYDATGALRDVGQNHLLIMLALVAMERPDLTSSDSIRRERGLVIRSLSVPRGRALSASSVRGQYEGYRREPHIKSDSTTETYFRITAFINNRRWKGVPFHLEAGKALAEDRVEIDVYFKGETDAKENQNILTFRIQPDEGIKIRFFVKKPQVPAWERSQRFSSSIMPIRRLSRRCPMRMSVSYAMRSSATRHCSASTEEIISSWKFIMPILENWGKLPLVMYSKGAREV